ncbi:MAG: hypothetical protein JWM99_4955 [Verrucomicrobiales bacterium]|nr:hypothetical protein [Verrucomicrobiales bacterium]
MNFRGLKACKTNQIGSGMRTLDSIFLRAVGKKNKGRDRIDAIALRDIGQCFRIHLRGDQFALSHLSRPGNFGCDHLARPAPGGPKIDQNGQRRTRSERLKCLAIGRFNGFARRRYGGLTLAAA